MTAARSGIGSLVPLLGAVAAVVLVVVAGVVWPPRPAPIATDRLGPESGMTVADYLVQAENSLIGPDGPRYALVSLQHELTIGAAADLAGDERVAEVVFRVPIPRVQTPVTIVGVGAGRASVLGAADIAVDLVRRSAATAPERQRHVAMVAADRIAADCACVVAFTVRAEPAVLRVFANDRDVRAVQALPSDAVGGTYAVVPLLPANTDIVEPLPDDGPVP